MKTKFNNLILNELSHFEKLAILGGKNQQTGRDSDAKNQQTGRDSNAKNQQTGRDSKF